MVTQWSAQQVLESSASSQLISVDSGLDALWVYGTPFVVDSNCFPDGLSRRELDVQHFENQISFATSLVSNENKNFLL